MESANGFKLPGCWRQFNPSGYTAGPIGFNRLRIEAFANPGLTGLGSIEKFVAELDPLERQKRVDFVK